LTSNQVEINRKTREKKKKKEKKKKRKKKKKKKKKKIFRNEAVNIKRWSKGVAQL